ncbi:MAG: hypothetical protein EOM19_08015 [Candidatus Moranbacteria bacterium]|nr:hypothetical protein [Candidatus Moranbacteria bacterium]
MKKLPKKYQSLLRSTPGPMPFFVKKIPSKVKWNGRRVIWKKSASTYPIFGVILMDVLSRRFLLIAMQGSYIIPTSKNTLLILYSGKKSINCIKVDVDSLQPLPGIKNGLAEIVKTKKEELILKGRILAQKKIAYSFDEKKKKVVFPKELADIEKEIFIFVRTNKSSQEGYGTTLAHLHFSREGSVRFFQQEWFNKGGFDFDYMSLDRAIKDPETGEILVEGLRMNFILLEKDGKTPKDLFLWERL